MALQRVEDINDEFVRIANNVKGFQGIFSQYGSEQDISPAMRRGLDAVISLVIAALFAAASPKSVSRELKLIERAIGSKTERGRARRALEAPGDADKVAIAFKRLGNAIDRFQVRWPSFWLASCPLTGTVARYGSPYGTRCGKHRCQ
jgi:hypothetical protein